MSLPERAAFDQYDWMVMVGNEESFRCPVKSYIGPILADLPHNI